MTFFKDLERGKDIENIVLEILKIKYPCSVIVDKFKGYDIWVPEKHYGIEVKYDPMSNETGNFLIEIEFNNKPSALITTSAHFWVIYDDFKFLFIEPMKIIQCIFLNKLQFAEFTGKGDDCAKKAFLIKKNLLYKYGKLIEKK